MHTIYKLLPKYEVYDVKNNLNFICVANDKIVRYVLRYVNRGDIIVCMGALHNEKLSIETIDIFNKFSS